MINHSVRTADEGEEKVNTTTQTGDRRKLKISLKRTCFRFEGFGGKNVVDELHAVCPPFLKWSGKVGVRTLLESLAYEVEVVDFFDTKVGQENSSLYSC